MKATGGRGGGEGKTPTYLYDHGLFTRPLRVNKISYELSRREKVMIEQKKKDTSVVVVG